jgi:CDP-paratose 2-epimerase
LEGLEYTVFGYKGKQVRDNIHSFDVAAFIHAFIETPRSGEVYNLGGGKSNSCSILEAFKLAEHYTGTSQRWKYSDVARVGDHICYYSDLRRMHQHYPNWRITKTLDDTVAEIAASWRARSTEAV